MSDRIPHSGRSAIYVGRSEARSFVSTLKTVDMAVIVPKKEGQSVIDQVETAVREASEKGERQGYSDGRERGYQEGFQEGRGLGMQQALQEGREASSLETAEFVSELNDVAERLQEEIARWFVRSEERMAELAMVAVRKLLAAELEISRDSALNIVKEALREVTHSRHVRIRVNPFDSAMLRDHRQEILAAAENLRDVDIVSDPSISGGCTIESDGGVVDATLDTRFALLEEGLRRAA